MGIESNNSPYISELLSEIKSLKEALKPLHDLAEVYLPVVPHAKNDHVAFGYFHTVVTKQNLLNAYHAYRESKHG
jgi:hypothetical protein